MAILAALARLLLVVAIAGSAWFALEQWRASDRAAERRALAARAAELNARVLVPGSPLACLAAEAAEGVEAACEAVVFAKAENAAAAVAFTEAQMTLVADGLDYMGHNGSVIPALAAMRRAIELDRYGLVAHVLATRDACTMADCAYFNRLRDAAVVKTNMQARTFDSYVARHAESWAGKPAAPVPVAAAPAPVEPEPASAPQASAPPAPATKYDFPSSKSIPAVSIMNAEPAAPKPREAEAKSDDAPVASDKPLPVPPRRPQSQAAAPAAR